VDHDILLNIIKAKIKDLRFIELIRKSLKAGYFEFRTYSHSPQGSILSPLLANIYMHKLDEFVLRLKTQFDIGTKASVNPE
jgi:retron-type reverse transcriptase